MPDAARIMTMEGKAKLEEELRYLENEKQEEISKLFEDALSHGDISENSEYDEARNIQNQTDARISEIKEILATYTLVDTTRVGDGVSIGSTVSIEYPTGAVATYKIVGTAEADPSAGQISNESAVGAALIGHKKGDHITCEGPTGRKIELTVTDVSH